MSCSVHGAINTVVSNRTVTITEVRTYAELLAHKTRSIRTVIMIGYTAEQ
jgi:sulfur carrier protein ThiS